MDVLMIVVITLLVYSFIAPIIDKVVKCIISYIQVFITKSAYKIQVINKDIQSLQVSNKKVIGFQINDTEECDEPDDGEEDCLK